MEGNRQNTEESKKVKKKQRMLKKLKEEREIYVTRNEKQF